MDADTRLLTAQNHFDVVELEGGKYAVSVRRGQQTIALLVPRNSSNEAATILAAKLEAEIRTVVTR